MANFYLNIFNYTQNKKIVRNNKTLFIDKEQIPDTRMLTVAIGNLINSPKKSILFNNIRQEKKYSHQSTKISN